MKIKMPNKALLILLVLAILGGCASMGGPAGDASYIGAATGKYANVYYRIEDSKLVIAFENTSTAYMRNLIISVEQKTNAGSSDASSTSSLLKTKALRHISLAIPHNATGDVVVRYYFFPQALPLAMSPYASSGAGFDEAYDDSVSFKIFIK